MSSCSRISFLNGLLFSLYLTKKAVCIARLLDEEAIPLVGVPEGLLSDRGTNLLSHLMQDVCEMLGIKKLNTTAYHPQCNEMVERSNCTIKTILHKHVAKFGNQWDRYLPGVLWVYKNTPRVHRREPIVPAVWH